MMTARGSATRAYALQQMVTSEAKQDGLEKTDGAKRVTPRFARIKKTLCF